MGCRFTNLSVSRGRSFCGSSNRLLGSLLVMFLRLARARHRQVGACVFHIQRAKRTLQMSTKLAFLPTFILPGTSCRNCPPSKCNRMLWLALFTEQRLDQPIIPYGVPSVIMLVKIASHSGKAGDDITSDCLTCCNNCFNRLLHSSKSTSSLCPFIRLNKIRK